MLSIIIPCYNMERYLPQCIDSLLDQNLNPAEFEIIIVNDESKDSTLRVANNYAAKHPNIIVVDKKNAGVGAARNTGYDLAKRKIPREFMVSTGIRFIEGKWMEDAILTSEIFLKAKRMAHVDYDVHRYRILPTSAMRNKSPEHYNKVIFDNANAAYVFTGRRVSLVRAFQKELKKSYPEAKVIAADANPKLAGACYAADDYFEVPRLDNPVYIQTLLKKCLEHDIALVIPTIDTELLLLAKNRDLFEKNGIQPPIDGSRSVDTFLIRTKEDLTDYHFSNEKLMFLEYIDHAVYDEFTCDLYYGKDNKLKCAVPRKRIEVRDGEVNKALTVNGELVDYIRKNLSYVEGAVGCLTAQFFMHISEPKIYGIEINPRFGGGYPLSYQAGANFPGWIISEFLLGEQIEDKFNCWEDNLLMIRSAYIEISKELQPDNWEQLFSRLFSIYRNKQDVFGYISSTYQLDKQELIHRYRNHIPNIKPFDGVLDTLQKIKDSKGKLAIITDGRSITQRNKLKKLGLLPFFDFIIVSEEIGTEKPHELNYKSVENHFNLKNYFYIADNFKKDFITPKKLDFYDTLVHRTVHPQYAIKLWGKFMIRELGLMLTADELFAIRIDSLAYLGQSQKKRILEVSYDSLIKEIYSRLINIDSLTDTDFGKFKTIFEQSDYISEISVQFKNDELVDALFTLKKKGYRVYLVTDFFFSKKLMRRIIDFHDMLPLFDDVFVSCEMSKSKEGSEIYPAILEEIKAQPEDIIMIGDNEKSDVINAAKFKIKSIHTKHSAHHFRNKKNLLGHDGKNFKKACSQVERSCRKSEHQFSEYIIHFYFFIERLYKKARRDNVNNLFFLAREGLYLKALFDFYQELNQFEHTHKIQTHYLKASRQSAQQIALKPLDEESFDGFKTAHRQMSADQLLQWFLFSEEIQNYNFE
ncbi:putative glycosyltransferase EpsJ [Nymphon striatum]|nr:putative glycosyltransferase EpsJ [Nymphon striatum]